MEYIKLFQNHSNYEDFVSGGTMVEPNVSHCVSENEVHYSIKEIQLYEITSYIEYNGDQGCAIYLDKPITEEYSNPIVYVYDKTTGELVGRITPSEISYNETETIIRVGSKPYESLVVFKYTRQDGTIATTNKFETGPQIIFH